MQVEKKAKEFLVQVIVRTIWWGRPGYVGCCPREEVRWLQEMGVQATCRALRHKTTRILLQRTQREASLVPQLWASETAAHFCLCLSEDRTKLFLESIEDLQNWLLKNGNTERELAYWIQLNTHIRADASYQEHGKNGMHVTTDGEPSQKSRCHRLGELHGKKDLQTLLWHPEWVHTSSWGITE